MEELNHERLYKFQNLKQNAEFQFLLSVVERWKQQAIDDVMLKRKPGMEERIGGEYEAYSRLLNLPDRIISDLQINPGMGAEMFDPYAQTK